MSDSRPAASFDAKYSTYSDMKYVELPKELVTLIIENFIRVEVGGWGTLIKIGIKRGAEVKMKQNGEKNLDSHTIYLVPPKNISTSVMTQNDLVKSISEVVKVIH